MHACYRTIIAILLMLALQLVALSSRAFAQRPLAVPGARSTIASGINDAGTIIVGAYIDTSGRDHGFLWQGGSFTALDVPGAWTPKPSGSMRPAPVSWACTRTPAARPTALCGRGAASPPSTSRARSTRAFGINAAGTIIVGDTRTPAARTTALCGRGAASPPSTSRARGAPEPWGSMRLAPSSWACTRTAAARSTALCGRGASPPSSTSQARGAPGLWGCGWHHHRGLVQGHQRHGPRIFCGGARFDFPGARSTQALGINAAGTIIVGMYADSSTTHGFVIP